MIGDYTDQGVIIPQRFIPFDIGVSIEGEIKTEIKLFLEREYSFLSDSVLLKGISSNYLFGVEISASLRVFIFSYGIGVFVINDSLFQIGHETYSVDYCKSRRVAHDEILGFRRGDLSESMKFVMNSLRSIAGQNTDHLRYTATNEWENNSLSYVMSVSYICGTGLNGRSYADFPEQEKKNLQILLRPSLAHMEDSEILFCSEGHMSEGDSLDFDIDALAMPKNWASAQDCSIYISWAAVVIFVDGPLMDSWQRLVEALEIDLQSMWFYAYSRDANLRNRIRERSCSVSELQKEKYYFRREYSEFNGEKGASSPMYLTEIRGELINTSGLNEVTANYLEFLDYCIDEAASRESERQKRYARVSEILLFIIAYIQIAPMIYDFLTTGFSRLEVVPSLVLVVVAVAGAFMVFRKE